MPARRFLLLRNTFSGSRKTASLYAHFFVREPVRFCLSKTFAPVPDAAADKLNRSAKASGSVFPALVDEAE